MDSQNPKFTNQYSVILSKQCPWPNQSNSSQIINTMITNNQYGCTSIAFGQWTNYQMNQICKYIDEWTTEHLYLTKNQCRTIIKEISEIKSMSCLMELYLQDNLIESIEPLCRVNVPVLMKLYLSKNKICDLKSFRKCNFQYLNSLEINCNLMREMEQLFEFKNEKLQQLRIDYPSSEKMYSQNCGYLMKCETTKLRDIGRTASQASLRFRGYMIRHQVYFKEMMEIMNGKYVGISIWAIK